MNNDTTTVGAVKELASEQGEWVNGEFEAVVTDAKPANGNKPSKATLADPDNPRITINASWFAGDLTKFEGARCLFGGQGMKIKLYKGNADLSCGEKVLINILHASAGGGSAPAGGSAGSSAVPKHDVNPITPAEKENKFHADLKKISLLLMHSSQYAEDVWNKIPDNAEIKKVDGALQSITSSIFITAKDGGLLNTNFALRQRGEDGHLFPYVKKDIPTDVPDPAEKARVAAELLAKQRAAEAAEKARIAAAEVDEEVPF